MATTASRTAPARLLEFSFKIPATRRAPGSRANIRAPIRCSICNSSVGAFAIRTTNTIFGARLWAFQSCLRFRRQRAGQKVCASRAITNRFGNSLFLAACSSPTSTQKTRWRPLGEGAASRGNRCFAWRRLTIWRATSRSRRAPSALKPTSPISSKASRRLRAKRFPSRCRTLFKARGARFAVSFLQKQRVALHCARFCTLSLSQGGLFT